LTFPLGDIQDQAVAEVEEVMTQAMGRGNLLAGAQVQQDPVQIDLELDLAALPQKA